MSNETNTGAEKNTIHRWEAVGLGMAPYKIKGYRVETYQACHGAKVQPGTSCDYCGQGIKYVVDVASADGKLFKVGMDCAKAASKEGTRTYTQLERRERDMKKADAARRASARFAALDDLLCHEAFRDALSAIAHPQDWAAGKGLTMLDYVTWMMDKAGQSGKLAAVRLINKKLGTKI